MVGQHTISLYATSRSIILYRIEGLLTRSLFNFLIKSDIGISLWVDTRSKHIFRSLFTVCFLNRMDSKSSKDSKQELFRYSYIVLGRQMLTSIIIVFLGLMVLTSTQVIFKLTLVVQFLFKSLSKMWCTMQCANCVVLCSIDWYCPST